MEEEWKVAYEAYEISNKGNCRRRMKDGTYKSIQGSLISTPSSKNKVYKMRYFQTQRDAKRTNHLFSHLVAKCFIGERPEGHEVDHIDRNPLNNNLQNLRYVTHRENCLNKNNNVDVPMETPNRRRAVQEKWEHNNRDIILQKKRDYYQNNKAPWEKQHELRRNDKVTLNCECCKNDYTIQKRSVVVKKTKNCSRCTSLINLPK